MPTRATTRGKRFGLRKVGTLAVIREAAILAEDTPAADILAADTQVVDIRGDPGAAVVTQGDKAEAQEIAAGTLKTIPKSSRSFILPHRS
jgi:hypothetical protein